MIEYTLVPARLLQHMDCAQLGTLVSHQFLHADIMHILGNMWILFIFGDNVEDRLGRWKYLIFYLSCGCIAGLTQVLANPSDSRPCIGASGAIAGVMGAYLMLYPHAGVKTFIWLFIVPTIPAWLILIGWFALNCYYSTVPGGCAQAIAWYAHLGGFCFGAAAILALPKLQSSEDTREDLDLDVDSYKASQALGLTNHALRHDAGLTNEVAIVLFVIMIAYSSYFALKSPLLAWNHHDPPTQVPVTQQVAAPKPTHVENKQSLHRRVKHHTLPHRAPVRRENRTD